MHKGGIIFSVNHKVHVRDINESHFVQ
jgi:hypothetical protein